MPIADDDLLDFLLSRWDSTVPGDRTRAWREILAEIAAHFRGRDGKAGFLGAFIGHARYDDDEERRQLLAIARRIIEEGEDDQDEEDAAPLSSKQLKQKRKDAAAQREATLKRFNDRFCVVNEGGRVFIFADSYDEQLDWHYWERLRRNDFLLMFETEKIITAITEEGKARYQLVATWWLAHPQRRTYVNGAVAKPRGETRAGVLNLWRGFGVEPRPGSWRRLRDHIRWVVCAGDEYSFDYLMGWMARAVQFPEEPGEVAIVMRGLPGSGKGILGHALRKLFGHHGLHISQSDHLTGKFNAHLRACVLLFADEAFFVGDKAGMRVLRALITEKVKTVEVKGGAIVQSPNMIHLIMASNDEWVVPVILGERRMAAFNVLDTFKGDYHYFKGIVDELKNGGYAAMLDELLHYDLTAFEVRNIPETNVLQEQREFTLSPVQAWWREVLERGYVYRSELGLEDKLHVWHVDVTSELLYASYRQYVRERRERMEQRGTILRFFTDILQCHKTRVRNLIVGERMGGGAGRGADVVRGQWPQTLRIGTLAEARARFERIMGIELADWPEPDEASDDVVVPLRLSEDE